ncbi:hypothetical protein FAZ15_05600 [Sphingobacterium olei]|uniref:Uncharacterized protein n=1 Tax=Sphingobacterium olei TaxID=2571155 RepID=A0A4U0P3S1_9SPHI|nr:hypothetical protein [Sphingobacterium olei]TJZ61987.1 hypothetical protein FAZ15_05600 [Sphingobacterium olei]
MDFKILFPAPYQVSDIYDDNLDINIILDDGSVYFGTLFTLANINKLMVGSRDRYFWSTDMLIVEDLSHEGINSSIEAVLSDGYFENVFSKIGTIKTVFPDFGWENYSDVSKIDYEAF